MTLPSSVRVDVHIFFPHTLTYEECLKEYHKGREEVRAMSRAMQSPLLKLVERHNCRLRQLKARHRLLYLRQQLRERTNPLPKDMDIQLDDDDLRTESSVIVDLSFVKSVELTDELMAEEISKAMAGGEAARQRLIREESTLGPIERDKLVRIILEHECRLAFLEWEKQCKIRPFFQEIPLSQNYSTGRESSLSQSQRSKIFSPWCCCSIS